MTHHWEALGWTLIHFCWQAAAIALVYKLADSALIKSRASTRYLLAILAMLGMLAVSLATLAYEEAHYRHFAPIAASHLITLAPGLQAITPSGAALDMPSAPKQTTRLLASDIIPWLDAFWIAGVFCLSFRTIGGWWLIRRLRHSALQKAPHTLRIHLDNMRLKMGIPRFVDLRLSSRIASPLTIGMIRPLVLLPMTALTGLSPEQLEVVLAHELAHIRRADYFWNILQTIIETLFFFHPVVWWISRQAREQRELCCDDVALEICSDPAIYASALLRLEEERKSRLHFAMALDGNQSRSGLRARILRILGNPEEPTRNLKPLSLAGMLAALLLFVCPLPQVFASFKQAPKISAQIVHAVKHVARPALKISAAKHKISPAPVAASPAPVVIASPTPGPPAAPSVHPSVGPPVIPEIAQNANASTNANAASSGNKGDYIDRMRSAGYDVDINEYVSMKSMGITPEYAQAMEKASGGKIKGSELIAMKVQGITPDYISQMRSAGYDVDIGKYIAMKVQGITPEYADAMSKAGLGKPDANELIAMKVQGVTPDYAKELHDHGIDVSSFHDLISYRIFKVSPEFLAGMKDAGFGSVPSKKLVALRVQGVTPEFAKSVKSQFPDATVDDLIQMRIFHIDGDFIASAKRHGFAPLTVQKLVKLRISGILEDDNNAKDNNP
jgi:beta-lactamase regulating signal transducer with metallopeptidase domain